METQKQTPVALKVVAVLFISSGVWTVLEILVSLARNTINFNLGVLGIFIGLGLLRFRRGWRTCALVYIWLAFILIAVFSLMVLGGGHPEPFYLKLFGQNIGYASPTFALFVAAVLFALVVWQYRVLTRPDVVKLFDDNAA
jgi:hypothetical protein